MRAALNVALVGYGLAGRVFHAPLVAHTPGLRLHTVVSGDPARVRADFPGLRVVAEPGAAFADDAIDLVVLATPNATHAPLAVAALEAGRHVVIDKPFAVSLQEAHRVADAAARHGRIASVFHNRRWDADFLALRALLDAGALGEPAELHSHFDRFRPAVAGRWRERAGPGAGLWFDLGPHLVDQALQLFGLPDTVQADIAIQRAGAEVDDWFHVLLQYPRLRVALHAGSLVAGNGLRFAAHGSRASFLKHGLDPQEAALRAGARPGTPDWGRDPQPGTLLVPDADGGVRARPATGPAGDYPRFYAGMRAAILGDGPPPVTLAEALDTMRVLEAAVASSRSGARVAP